MLTLLASCVSQQAGRVFCLDIQILDYRQFLYSHRNILVWEEGRQLYKTLRSTKTSTKRERACDSV